MIVPLAAGTLEDLRDNCQPGISFSGFFQEGLDFALRGRLADVHAWLLGLLVGRATGARGDEVAFGFVWVEGFGLFAEGFDEVVLARGRFHADEVWQ